MKKARKRKTTKKRLEPTDMKVVLSLEDLLRWMGIYDDEMKEKGLTAIEVAMLASQTVQEAVHITSGRSTGECVEQREYKQDSIQVGKQGNSGDKDVTVTGTLKPPSPNWPPKFTIPKDACVLFPSCFAGTFP